LIGADGGGCRRLGIALVALGALFAAQVAGAQAIFRSGFEFARPARSGGSNFIWYALGPQCEREPYAAIPNYHGPGVRDLVRTQLQQMRESGQDSLSLGLYHLRAADQVDAVGRVTGTLLDSTGGDLHPRMRQNLVEFLADIRGAGYFSVVFRYHPQGANNPREWEQLGPAQQDLLEENWNLIANLEPLLQQSGLNWATDLLVEGMPRARIVELPGDDYIEPETPAREGWSRYAREIWRRYSGQFGTSRTVGFSFVSDTDDTRIDARVEHIDYVYTIDGTRRLPLGFALDIYGTASRGEGWIFRAYHRHLRDEGLSGVPWILAETYYDDATAASELVQAMTATGQPVYFLTQWPLRRGNECDPNVDVAPPVDYANYRLRGF
jgi:hypothetical protein